MLFSNPEVSKFVGENFVAAWESVRPVPVVEIDFGNGRKLKRTVNGNIATYICAPDGRVIDVIPGLNTPEAYLQELRYALDLYRSSFVNFESVVRNHHALHSMLPGNVPVIRADAGKAMVEAPVKKAVAPAKTVTRADVGKKIVEFSVKTAVESPAPSSEAAALAADTEFNRRERKPLVHKILAERIVRPAEITKRIYKDVLRCDLDDPFLGLASSAFNGGAYETP